jgi:hypothetical protein
MAGAESTETLAKFKKEYLGKIGKAEGKKCTKVVEEQKKVTPSREGRFASQRNQDRKDSNSQGKNGSRCKEVEADT